MKNIINYKIDFGKMPNEVKKYLYIYDELYRGMKVNSLSNKQKLVEIKNNEIKCEPFWNDELVYTGDKEIDDLINLEAEEMKKFLEKNKNFGIFVREEVKEKLFEKIYNYFLEKNQKNNLGKTGKELYEETSEMISDPNLDISPHVTGGAVDVVLYKQNGELVDMGCPINFIGEKANLTTIEITKEQRKNRDLLVDIFLENGFSNLASEWWHFSYGDPYWATFYGKKEALYGMI